MIARLVTFSLAVALCVAVGCRKPAAPDAPDAPAPPKPPDVSHLRTADEVRDAYLKAADAKDHATMAALGEAPWLDTDRRVVRDRDGLTGAAGRAAGQLPAADDREVETTAYKTVRDKIEKEADRKVLDEVLGDDGLIVHVRNKDQPFTERYVLVRVTGGVARVVGGPLKRNQLIPSNPVPDAVARAFDAAESFELYALNPDPRDRKDDKTVGKDTFYGWKVLGKTEVKAAEDRKRMVDALRLGIEDNPGAVAGCFNPRHGLRMKAGADTVDLVICFECLSAQAYLNGKPNDGFLTMASPQPTFDAVLTAAGVTPAKK